MPAMSARPKTPAQRRKALEDRERAKGRVQRKRWAHPKDWPEIDRLIAELNKARESGA